MLSWRVNHRNPSFHTSHLRSSQECLSHRSMLGTYVVPCLLRQKVRRKPHFGEDTKLESVYAAALWMDTRTRSFEDGDTFTLIYCCQQGSITRYASSPSCLMLSSLRTKPADMNLPCSVVNIWSMRHYGGSWYYLPTFPDLDSLPVLCYRERYWQSSLSPPIPCLQYKQTLPGRWSRSYVAVSL